ncbi:MAG TPA: ABC transporter permease, partial [Draconibacterium sp.]|nr:ABC transporter permease [Draconibacterium sp.]
MNNTSLKIILRRLVKDKTISLVNLIGLSLGFTCAIILTSWVLYETSYDKHIPGGDKIYRITLEGNINGEFVNSTQTIAGIGPELKKDFPEVDNYVRLINNYKDCIIKLEGKETFRESGYAADSTFFDIFPYKAIYGNLTTSLSKKNQIVIDQYLSEKCFGKKDPVGQIIQVDNQKYNVAAVMENIPSHSHLKFHFLIPFINVDWIVQNPWGGDNAITFLKLNRTDNIGALESKITEMVYTRQSLWKDLKIDFRLQPLYDIYLSQYNFDYSSETGSKKNI